MEDAVTTSVDELATPSHLIVGLAVNGSRKTKYVVKWALDKFVPEGMLLFKLVFIRPKITRIPTPMGSLPISQAREDVAIAYRKELEWQTYEELLPLKNMCASRKVEVEIVQIESDDVVDAIKHEIVKNNISKLVIGASSKGMFSRGQNLSSRICEITPSFCTVYVILKGELSSLRASNYKTIGYNKDDNNSSLSSTITRCSSLAPSSGTEMSLLDAISCKTFNKNEFVSHVFEPDDAFYMEQTKKSTFEPHPRRQGAQTRTEPSRSSSPTEPVITESCISSKRAREDSQDVNEGKVLVRRRRRRRSAKRSTTKHDEAVIDQLARHLYGESSPQYTDIVVTSSPELSIYPESDHTDDYRATRESTAYESDIQVMALKSNEKCWDMRNVILSLEETEVGQAATLAQVKAAEIACAEVEEKIAKMKESLESTRQLMEAQTQQHRLKLERLQSDQDKQMKLQTNVEAECARLQEANTATQAQMAIMKQNIDSMTQQLLYNVTDHASQIAELKGAIDILTVEKNWLLTHGFSHFSNKIRSCAEMINAIAKVNTAANRVGYNEGIKAGYYYALEACIPIYEVPDLQANNAHDHLVEAAEEFKHTSFSCAAELAEMVGAPFEHIKSFIQTPYDHDS